MNYFTSEKMYINKTFYEILGLKAEINKKTPKQYGDIIMNYAYKNKLDTFIPFPYGSGGDTAINMDANLNKIYKEKNEKNEYGVNEYGCITMADFSIKTIKSLKPLFITDEEEIKKYTDKEEEIERLEEYKRKLEEEKENARKKAHKQAKRLEEEKARQMKLIWESKKIKEERRRAEYIYRQKLELTRLEKIKQNHELKCEYEFLKLYKEVSKNKMDSIELFKQYKEMSKISSPKDMMEYMDKLPPMFPQIPPLLP